MRFFDVHSSQETLYMPQGSARICSEGKCSSVSVLITEGQFHILSAFLITGVLWAFLAIAIDALHLLGRIAEKFVLHKEEKHNQQQQQKRERENECL